MDSAWNIDEITKLSLLYDFYGQLLTERQSQVFELYHGENLSLAEIAEELGISRQGVHDALRSARKALDGYEQKLGLVERFLSTETAIAKIDEEILAMIALLQASDGAEADTEGAGIKQSDGAEGDTEGAGTKRGTENNGAGAEANTEGAESNQGTTAADLIRRLNKVKSIIDRLEE